MMIQNKQIELKLLNAKIEQDKIKHKLREQDLRVQQATPLSATQQPPSSNPNCADHNIRWVILWLHSNHIKKKIMFLLPALS